MSDSDLPPSAGPDFTTGTDTPVILPGMIGPTWQEQDAALRDLWMQNKTPQEISAVLNRSVAAIMTRAARLGLPRRSAPGRKPGSRRMPGSAQVRNTQPRTTTYAPPQQEGESAPQVSTRICLMCLRSFQSQGRHNRICPSCKGSSEYGAAVALADIHFPV